MAKKRVKYSFGTPAAYAAMAKKDQYTIYFVYDTVKDANGKDVPAEFGTIYKGTTRIGSAKASDIVFDTVLNITVLQGATEEDSLIYTIEPGTSLTDFVDGLLKQVGTWDQSLYSQFVGDGTAENPGIILTTIQNECNFNETEENPVGTIANAINYAINRSITPQAEGGTEVISSWVNANFVSNDKLGKIQELAGILTDETVDILVEAATNIQNLLVNYYTKDEADAKLKEVKFFASDLEFPEEGNEEFLYVDCDENVLYRWGKEEDTNNYAYIQIGGSGQNANIEVESTIRVKNGKTTLSVAKGNGLSVEFIFSSAYTYMKYKHGQFEKIMSQTGTIGSARYYLDGVQFDSGEVRQSAYDENAEAGAENVNIYNRINIAASRLNSTTHELKIVCTDTEKHEAVETIYINVISVSINSSYVSTPTNLTNNVVIPVSVVSTTPAELFYTIDDEDTVKVKDVPVGSPVIPISISPISNGQTRSHGYHRITIWATTYIEESETTIKTSELVYDVIWYESGNSLPIITTSYNIEANDEGKYDMTQYEYGTLKYQVYSDSGQTTIVDLIIKNLDTDVVRKVNTLEVDSITKSWTYTFDEVGNYELYVDAHYEDNGEDITLSSDKYEINVRQSDISMDATEGSVLYFTAKDRFNEEANPGVWVDKAQGVEAQLDGFLWNNLSGWYTDQKNATTSLRVAGGAKCTIPFTPFNSNKKATGQTIEFDFKTSSLSDSTAKVIECYSERNKIGIEVTATGAYFSSTEFGLTTDGDSRIFVPFKEDERIRLSFVITPEDSDEEGHSKNDPEANVSLWNGNRYEEQNSIQNGWWRFVKVYINGICVSINNYKNYASFVQTFPSNIVIGSDKATIDIFSIRVYNTVLYDRAIVNNFIADTQNPVEKLRLFKRNNILNENGTDVSPTALRRLMPCLFITCQSDATTSGIVNNEHILPTNKNDKRGVTMFFDCDGLDDEAKEYYNFCHTFVAFNVQFTVQGTSSQYYPRRNWKATIKSEKKYKDDYVATATGSKPTYIFIDTPWEEDIKNGRDARALYAAKYQNKYKNKYQLKDFSEEFTGIKDENRTVDEISSIPAKKFCLKADFAESSGTHNTGLAKYVDFIMKSMGYDYLTPPQKAQYNKTRNMVDVTFRTSVDGYPIAMFWRPTYEDDWEFYGKFNFNIDKGAEAAFGFIDLDDGGITDSDVNPTTGYPFVLFDEDYYDAASQEDRIAYESPVECWEFTNNSTDLCKFRNVTPTSFTEKSKDADGVTELPSWLGSFEARHPDNDNMNEEDYGTGLKKPVHWAAFSEWVSSTDRNGYHNFDKNLPVPTLWGGTYNDLISGSANKEIFATYEGTIEQIRTESIDPTTEDFLDKDRRYILQPIAVDPGDGTISPDKSYTLYGHIVHYNYFVDENDKSAWYDENAELNTWVDDGLYIEEETEVDTSKAYYIGNDVYSFNKSTSTWNRIASIEDYRLDAPVNYNMVTYAYDTAEYRFAKFKYDLPQHMNIPVTTAYYVMTEFFGCADQRAKNMMFVSWGYEPGFSNTRPANAFANEEEANAAGYKGVYKYELSTPASAATPTRYAEDENNTRGIVLGADPATICINEIDPNGKKMEFYNPTNSAITLTSYTLKGVDENNEARDPWTFPEGSTIAAHGFYVVTFAKGGDPLNGPTYGLSPKKAWSFTLEDNNHNVIDTIVNNLYTDGTNGFPGSWGRERDGGETWKEFATPSIGYSNALEFVNHVCINEVFANAVGIEYPTTKGIELYNPTDASVNLGGWTLKKGDVGCDSFYYLTGELDKQGQPKSKQLDSVENDSKAVTFTNDLEIGPKGYFVVHFNDGVTPNTKEGGIGPKSGWVLRLYDNNNNLIDELDNAPKVAYKYSTTDPSTGEPIDPSTGEPIEGTYILGTDASTGASVYIVDKEYVIFEGSSANHTQYRSWGRILDGATTWTIFDKGTPGLDNTTDMTPKYETTSLLDITKYTCIGNELSGLVYNNTNDGFIAVSDTGVIYDITLDGQVTAKNIENYDPSTRFLGVSATTEKTWKQGIDANGDKTFDDVTDNVPDIIPNSDLEAITKDSEGNIYIMSEYRSIEIKSTEKYPVYTDNVTGEETFDSSTNGVANTPIIKKGVQQTKKKTIDTVEVYAYIYKLNGNRLEIVTRLDVDESMEGFCYYKDNLFFVGKQVTGKIYLADLTGATPSSIVSLTEFADLTEYIAEVADVAYDGENVWALDSEEKSISKVSISQDGSTGEFDEKLLLTITESNPEGLLVDKAQNIFWICCDDDITDESKMLNNYKNLFKVGMDNSNYIPEGITPGTPITDHIVLNEFDGANKQIEIYNPTDNAVNLGGLWLVKTPQDPGFNDEIAITENNPTSSYDTWQFPAGTIIASKGFYVVTCGQTDEAQGPTFGLSMKNESKKFDMYLMTDATNLRNAVGAQTVDMTKVIDHVDNYTHPTVIVDNNGTLGRVKDGYSNFCVFRAPGTIGSSNDLGEIQGPANTGGEGGDTPATATTIKTVLYWVPINAEYIWYPIFYDNDTILSLDNTGHIKFNPNVESTDKVGTGYAYNGTESVLWVNFKDAYDAEIRSTYVNMRSKGGLTYANCMKYFNTSQSAQWPENVYNIDGKFKYVIPATKGYIDYSTQDETGKYGVRLRNSTYLYECQGSREEHRKWWLSNRFTYMDSRYFAVAYAEDYATIRLYTPKDYAGVEPSSTFKLTPYADMYLRVMFGQIVSTLRAEKNKTYDIIPSDPNLRFNDTETIIYGASNILSFGDMTNKYAGSVAIDRASKITDILLGADEPYYNQNITAAGLTIGASNSTLRNIDVRGCTKLSNIIGLNQITSIETVDARRTSISSLDFSENGANLNEVWYPTTVANLTLVNMNNIDEAHIHIPTYENLQVIHIENCPQLKNTSWNIISNVLTTRNNMLAGVTVVGFDWTITSNAAFEVWKKLITLRDHDYAHQIPYLSGTLRIGGVVKVSTGYKEGIEEMFREAGGLKVIVNPGSVVDLTGIEIVPEADILNSENTAIITPNKTFKFKISYLPDDFVLPAKKGVTWSLTNNNANVEIVDQTENDITLRYNGSTSGVDLFVLNATSLADSTKTASLHIQPAATLTRIKVTDTLGNEIGDDYLVIDEGYSETLRVKFLPEGTDDTNISIAANNNANFVYEYDTNNQTLTITGGDVTRDQVCNIVLTSVNVPTIKKIINFRVHNIVSRIINIKNSIGDLISGSVTVSYTDEDGVQHEAETYSSTTGVITLRTDGPCGFNELRVEPHANEEGIKYYNFIKSFIIPELPKDATEDTITDVTFYEPIEATINILNAGAPIDDKRLLVKSLENETIRSLTSAPYNNILGGKASATGAGTPVKMKLLANTEHHITVTELDDETDTLIPNGGRYSQYSGVINTGIDNDTYTIILSRDYLGNISESELHMTVMTGSGSLNTVRIYVKTEGEITIDWGDREDNSGDYTTVIDGTTGKEFGQELVLYHRYSNLNKEYDITVKENTNRITWFHVISERSNELTPCIGTTTGADGFNGSWSQRGNCGIVAYQSIGDARITKAPTFRIADAANKRYCKFLSVGNIYKKCTTITSAEELFLNSTVEQIYSGATQLFSNCVNITTFRSTFENSNVINIPNGFFLNNKRATNFNSTFKNCTNLITINSAADLAFIKQDPDVEVETLEEMFSGCVNLTSQVPELWRTYYGCSFNAIKAQNTFKNCIKVQNMSTIPGTWGGPVSNVYIEKSAYKELRYLDLSGTYNRTSPVEFILQDIYPKAHYRYVYDIQFVNELYEMIPLFGCAIGTTDGTNTEITSVVDFNRGGDKTGAKPNIYTGNMPYRINADPSDEWTYATYSNGEPAQVFKDEWGGTGRHIIMDISYTTPGVVTIFPVDASGNIDELNKKEFVLSDWNKENTINWQATLPLKILNIYNTREVQDMDNIDGTPEDPIFRSDVIRGCFIKIHSMTIYDSTDDSIINDPIYEIVPAFGQIPNSNTMAPFLYDKKNDRVYPLQGSPESLTLLKYYAKNE